MDLQPSTYDATLDELAPPPYQTHRSISGDSMLKPLVAASIAAEEVPSAVLALVSNLVTLYPDSDSTFSSSMLESCAKACSEHGYSLSKLLQDTASESMAGHTPIYWAIVNRTPTSQDASIHKTGLPGLISALLSYTSPLTERTILDIRHGCLAASDQHVFQGLRLSPLFNPLSGPQAMLLGGAIPHDEITVKYPEDEGEFEVKFKIPHFHKRMRVVQHIALDLIAKGTNATAT
ncbi:hypothetical protein DXG03_006364 [Asterophora parasitica]|uniref:Uncharacterized protein n=1 Tax=Asterophora parasitica TaxID=117018 RepID=A0A9P7K8E4_9AGAR|nr:hypothetical protein DXG03_006364 [Asterophora parasitica]